MVMWRCLIVAVGAVLTRSGSFDDVNYNYHDSVFDEGWSHRKFGNVDMNDFAAVRSVLMLIDASGVDLNKKFGDVGQAFIHLAAVRGDAKNIPLFKEFGADLNLQDKAGHTPLLLASIDGRTKSVEALLDSGANPNIAREDGVAPLHVAAAR